MNHNTNPKNNGDSSDDRDQNSDKVCYREAKEYILSRMKNDLPDYLRYHSADHTLDVMRSAERIALQEGVNSEELLLLKTAALYHDSGFLVGTKNHEEKSCILSRRILPKFDYTEEQIETVCGMIMATQLPQDPHSHLEEILCDADLDYLGRDDFWDIAKLLYEEFLNLDVVKNEQDWNELQVRFFESHEYCTETAQKWREDKKQEHLEEIKKLVDAA